MAKPQVAPSAASVISGILTADLVSGGTVVLNYPKLQPSSAINTVVKNKGHFFGVGGHKLVTPNSLYSYPNDFEVTLGTPAVGITLTWRGATVPAGTSFKAQLNEMGNISRSYGGPGVTQLFPGQIGGGNVVGGASGADTYLLNIGAPIAKSTTGICAVQAAAGGANAAATINGASAISGTAYLDVPRAVDAVSSNVGDTTQTVTVRGTDFYGQAMTESIALNGTTRVSGKKAFFIVTSVKYSANLAGNLSLGTTDILGLPSALYGAGYVVKEIQDGATATAGTFVTAASVTPTASTADVRGTYLPNAATDGTKALHIIAFLANPGDIGQVQFSA